MTFLKLSFSLADIPNPTSVLLMGEGHSSPAMSVMSMRSLPHLYKAGYGDLLAEQIPEAVDRYAHNIKTLKQHGTQLLDQQQNVETLSRLAQYAITKKLGMSFVCADWPDRLTNEQLHTTQQNVAANAIKTAEQTTRDVSDMLTALSKDGDALDIDSFQRGIVYGSFGAPAFTRLHDRLDLTNDQKEKVEKIGQAVRKNNFTRMEGIWNGLQVNRRNDHIIDVVADTLDARPRTKKAFLCGTYHIVSGFDAAYDAGTLGAMLRDEYDIESVSAAYAEEANVAKTLQLLKEIKLSRDDVTLNEFFPYAESHLAISPADAALALRGDPMAHGIHDMRSVSDVALDYVVLLPGMQKDDALNILRTKIGHTLNLK